MHFNSKEPHIHASETHCFDARGTGLNTPLNKVLNTADVKMHKHNRGEDLELFLRHLLKILIRLSFCQGRTPNGTIC